MAPRHVTVVGREILEKRLAGLPSAIEAAARRSVRDETMAAADDMRINAPVKTGELKAGIQAEVDLSALEGRAVTTAEHSKYVVHGTSDTPANDFITPAALRSRARFPGRVRAEVAAELRKITG